MVHVITDEDAKHVDWRLITENQMQLLTIVKDILDKKECSQFKREAEIIYPGTADGEEMIVLSENQHLMEKALKALKTCLFPPNSSCCPPKPSQPCPPQPCPPPCPPQPCLPPCPPQPCLPQPCLPQLYLPPCPPQPCPPQPCLPPCPPQPYLPPCPPQPCAPQPYLQPCAPQPSTPQTCLPNPSYVCYPMYGSSHRM